MNGGFIYPQKACPNCLDTQVILAGAVEATHGYNHGFSTDDIHRKSSSQCRLRQKLGGEYVNPHFQRHPKIIVLGHIIIISHEISPQHPHFFFRLGKDRMSKVYYMPPGVTRGKGALERSPRAVWKCWDSPGMDLTVKHRNFSIY